MLEKQPKWPLNKTNMVTKKYRFSKLIRTVAVIAILGVSLPFANTYGAYESSTIDLTDQVTMPSASFVSATNQASLDNHGASIVSPIIVQDNYYLAQNQPLNEATKKSVVRRSAAPREMIVTATAYSSTPDQTDASPFIAADGTHVYDGMVAANFLPFDTQVQIPDLYGDKVFEVHDRMNKRYPNRLDVWFPDRQSAKEFGVRKIKIKVL